jgi:hypothetical protein
LSAPDAEKLFRQPGPPLTQSGQRCRLSIEARDRSTAPR